MIIFVQDMGQGKCVKVDIKVYSAYKSGKSPNEFHAREIPVAFAGNQSNILWKECLVFKYQDEIWKRMILEYYPGSQ